jgi:hypothetical protein
MKNKLIITNIFLLTSFLIFIYLQGYYGPKFCIPFEHVDRCFYLYQVMRDTIQFFAIIFLPVTILVCLFKDSVVATWWKFARWAIPIVLMINMIINSGIHHNPYGKWQDIFDIPVLIVIYLVFIIGSIIQIVRGYRNGRE